MNLSMIFKSKSLFEILIPKQINISKSMHVFTVVTQATHKNVLLTVIFV